MYEKCVSGPKLRTSGGSGAQFLARNVRRAYMGRKLRVILPTEYWLIQYYNLISNLNTVNHSIKIFKQLITCRVIIIKSQTIICNITMHSGARSSTEYHGI